MYAISHALCQPIAVCDALPVISAFRGRSVRSTRDKVPNSDGTFMKWGYRSDVQHESKVESMPVTNQNARSSNLGSDAILVTRDATVHVV